MAPHLQFEHLASNLDRILATFQGFWHFLVITFLSKLCLPCIQMSMLLHFKAFSSESISDVGQACIFFPFLPFAFFVQEKQAKSGEVPGHGVCLLVQCQWRCLQKLIAFPQQLLSLLDLVQHGFLFQLGKVRRCDESADTILDVSLW